MITLKTVPFRLLSAHPPQVTRPSATRKHRCVADFEASRQYGWLDSSLKSRCNEAVAFENLLQRRSMCKCPALNAASDR